MRKRVLSWLPLAAKAAQAAGKLIPTVLLATGVAVVAAGVGMIYRPAGVIAAGIMLAAAGIVMMVGGEDH